MVTVLHCVSSVRWARLGQKEKDVQDVRTQTVSVWGGEKEREIESDRHFGLNQVNRSSRVSGWAPDVRFEVYDKKESRTCGMSRRGSKSRANQAKGCNERSARNKTTMRTLLVILRIVSIAIGSYKIVYVCNTYELVELVGLVETNWIERCMHMTRLHWTRSEEKNERKTSDQKTRRRASRIQDEPEEVKSGSKAERERERERERKREKRKIERRSELIRNQGDDEIINLEFGSCLLVKVCNYS